MANINWNPRFDLDLIQRVVTIILYSWFGRLVSSWICLGCFKPAIDVLTLILLGLAVARSSLQYTARGKAVLITGSFQAANSSNRKLNVTLGLQDVTLDLASNWPLICMIWDSLSMLDACRNILEVKELLNWKLPVVVYMLSSLMSQKVD